MGLTFEFALRSNERSGGMNRRWISRLVGIMLVVGICWACSSGGYSDQAGSSSSSSSSSRTSTHTVVFEAEATGAVDVYHTNDSGGNATGVYQTPYSKTYRGMEEGTHLYFTAQDQTGRSNAEVTVRLKVDGRTVEQNTSSGPYCIADLSGYL